ncbi:hypothetical protein [Micromonospora sp. NPDC051141]|uniref:hypothetical protein n=1 Tax=Micromonospora sp. NPDC051141 TaxID=3364284 RepID=UPI003797B434
MAVDLSLPLSAGYGDLTLLVCGLSTDGTRERYLFVDLGARTVRETTIDIGDLRARQLAVLRDRLGDGPVPYGLGRLEDLLSYFLHPHSFVQTADGEVVVSFKQAPYLRRLGRDGDARLWPPATELDFAAMQSSTKCEVEPGVIGFAMTDAEDRLRRYHDPEQPLRSSAWRYDLRTGAASRLGDLPEFACDTIHELDASPNGFMVGVDMDLSVRPGPDGRVRGTDGGSFDVARYAANEFPTGRFVVADEKLTRASVHTTGASCSAHVDVDLDDPNVFYVSCNNISKWQNNVVVHGPGVLERWRYQDGAAVREAAHTGPTFLRITSQQLFHRDGRQLIAVTGFPNRLFVLDPADMSTVFDLELFAHEPVQPPFVCAKNSQSPLYLAVEPGGRYVFMTGASTLFVVDLDEGRVVEQVPFCEPGSLMATAHIGFVR